MIESMLSAFPFMLLLFLPLLLLLLFLPLLLLFGGLDAPIICTGFSVGGWKYIKKDAISTPRTLLAVCAAFTIAWDLCWLLCTND